MKDKFSQSKFAQIFEVREDVVDKRIPHIELTGNRELIISNVTGILEYKTEEMRFQTGLCPVIIKGRDLVITVYSKETIIIKGFIERVEMAA